MDFTLSPRGEEYRSRIRAFVERELIPLEEHADSYDEHENISLALLQTMRARARQQGLWCLQLPAEWRSEEHTSELQSLMRISYAVFCLKKKKKKKRNKKNE